MGQRALSVGSCRDEFWRRLRPANFSGLRRRCGGRKVLLYNGKKEQSNEIRLNSLRADNFSVSFRKLVRKVAWWKPIFLSKCMCVYVCSRTCGAFLLKDFSFLFQVRDIAATCLELALSFAVSVQLWRIYCADVSRNRAFAVRFNGESHRCIHICPLYRSSESSLIPSASMQTSLFRIWYANRV